MKKWIVITVAIFILYMVASGSVVDPTSIYIMDKLFRLFVVSLLGFYGGWAIAAGFDFLNSHYIEAKPLLEKLSALVAFILFAPLFPLIALAIKLDSAGTVFYRQLRVGEDRRRGDRRSSGRGIFSDRRTPRDRRTVDYGGKPFEILKFRSMYADAEKQSGPTWAKQNDPRVTRMGALLRRTHFDELPQLLNVLWDDMSLVGPRPERPYFVMRFKRELPDYQRRLMTKPGVTGLAQVCHKADQSLEDVKEKLRYDLAYLDSVSMGLDLRIFIHTVRKALTGKTALGKALTGMKEAAEHESFFGGTVKKATNALSHFLF